MASEPTADALLNEYITALESHADAYSKLKTVKPRGPEKLWNDHQRREVHAAEAALRSARAHLKAALVTIVFNMTGD